jgi:hypothetical protein
VTAETVRERLSRSFKEFTIRTVLADDLAGQPVRQPVTCWGYGGRVSMARTIATLLLLLCMLVSGRALAQDIWLAPNGGNDHYVELLKSSDPWSSAAKKVKAFKIANQFAIFARDAEFAEFVAGVKRLNLEIAMEGLMLTSSDRCGHQVEGYTGPAAILRAAQRIQRYGAKLARRPVASGWPARSSTFKPSKES